MKKIINKIKAYYYEIGVFAFYLMSRLPSLGHDMFNTDVFKWKARSFNFGSGIFELDFANTLQKYHPGVILMWIGTIGVKINNLYYDIFVGTTPPDNLVSTVFDLHFFQKLVLTIVLGVTFAFIFYGLRKIFDTRFAAISVFFLMFEPFYIALSRTFHLEGLLSTFMITSFVWLFYFLIDRSCKKRLLVSAFFAALAVLTKTPAVYMLLFTALILFIESRKPKFLLQTFGLWFLGYVLTIVALWPALWVVPQLVFETLSEGIFSVGVDTAHFQFYFGNFVENPSWSFYFVVLGIRSSIILFIGLICLAVVFAKKLQLSTIQKKYVAYLGIFVFFYFLEITLPSKKLDRYVLPSLMGLSLLSSFGVYQILNLFKKWQNYILCLFFAFTAVVAVYIHPDYLSYYNPLFGGLKSGIYITEPKWMIGQHQIVEFFESERDKEKIEVFLSGETVDEFLNKPKLDYMLTIGFQEKYYTQVWPFISEIGGRATIADISAFAKETRYFVYPVWDDASLTEDRFKLRYVDSIKLRGVELYKVYERIY